VYLEKAFENTGWRPASPLPVARDLGNASLMWLVHPTLTDAEIQKTANVISMVLTKASK
jgi:dTDP-4-amino-4,6-dideoxygalactose transaminase